MQKIIKAVLKSLFDKSNFVLFYKIVHSFNIKNYKIGLKRPLIYIYSDEISMYDVGSVFSKIIETCLNESVDSAFAKTKSYLVNFFGELDLEKINKDTILLDSFFEEVKEFSIRFVLSLMAQKLGKNIEEEKFLLSNIFKEFLSIYNKIDNLEFKSLTEEVDLLGDIDFSTFVSETNTYDFPLPNVPEVESSRLFLFQAPPKNAKSFMLLNLAIYYFFKYTPRILFLSLENTKAEVLRRATAILFDIPIRQVTITDIKKFQYLLKKLKENNPGSSFKMKFKKKYSVEELSAELDAHSYDFVFIDYIDKMSTQITGLDKIEKSAHIVNTVFNLTGEHNLVCFAASQLNKDALLKQYRNKEIDSSSYSRTIVKIEASDVLFVQYKYKTEINGSKYLVFLTDVSRYFEEGEKVYIPMDLRKGKLYFSDATTSDVLDMLEDINSSTTI